MLFFGGRSIATESSQSLSRGALPRELPESPQRAPRELPESSKRAPKQLAESSRSLSRRASLKPTHCKPFPEECQIGLSLSRERSSMQVVEVDLRTRAGAFFSSNSCDLQACFHTLERMRGKMLEATRVQLRHERRKSGIQY